MFRIFKNYFKKEYFFLLSENERGECTHQEATLVVRAYNAIVAYEIAKGQCERKEAERGRFWTIVDMKKL